MNNPSSDKFNPINSLKLFSLDEQFNAFISLYKNQNLPKVILLTGEKGIGKFTLMFHFINYIFSLNSEYPYNHDDLIINENSPFYKRIIINTEQNFNYIGSSKPSPATIEDIRNMKKKFSKSPLNNQPRFTILDDVELLNINAANALLKLIEEPSIYDYFILINNKKKKIIETLHSRSIEVKIFLESEQKNLTFNLLKNNFEIENNYFAKFIKFTTPGMLIRYLSLFEELKIKNEDNFYDIITKSLHQFKKSKNTLSLDAINFLLDIKFYQLTMEKNAKVLEILEIKNKLTNLFYQYRNFNLNSDSVFNQFKLYSNYVR